MKTFRRICLQDYPIIDGEKSFVLQRGKEYITSLEQDDGTVIVFTRYWIRGVPVWRRSTGAWRYSLCEI